MKSIKKTYTLRKGRFTITNEIESKEFVFALKSRKPSEELDRYIAVATSIFNGSVSNVKICDEKTTYVMTEDIFKVNAKIMDEEEVV